MKLPSLKVFLSDIVVIKSTKVTKPQNWYQKSGVAAVKKADEMGLELWSWLTGSASGQQVPIKCSRG